MVAPKIIASANKNGEKPTPSKFVEPDGMMSIDLNSNEYISEEQHKQLVKKNKKWEELKYLGKLLCLLGSICMVIAIFMILAFLDKEYHFTSSTTIKLNQTTKTPADEEFFSQYISNISTEILKKKLHIKDYPRKLILCKLTRNLENCCDILRESNIQELVEICALDNILKSFVDYEISSKRRKRQTDSQYYGDHDISPVNYEDYYFEEPTEEVQPAKDPHHNGDNYFNTPMMEPNSFSLEPHHPDAIHLYPNEPNEEEQSMNQNQNYMPDPLQIHQQHSEIQNKIYVHPNQNNANDQPDTIKQEIEDDNNESIVPYEHIPVAINQAVPYLGGNIASYSPPMDNPPQATNAFSTSAHSPAPDSLQKNLIQPVQFQPFPASTITLYTSVDPSHTSSLHAIKQEQNDNAVNDEVNMPINQISVATNQVVPYPSDNNPYQATDAFQNSLAPSAAMENLNLQTNAIKPYQLPPIPATTGIPYSLQVSPLHTVANDKGNMLVEHKPRVPYASNNIPGDALSNTPSINNPYQASNTFPNSVVPSAAMENLNSQTISIQPHQFKPTPAAAGASYSPVDVLHTSSLHAIEQQQAYNAENSSANSPFNQVPAMDPAQDHVVPYLSNKISSHASPADNSPTATNDQLNLPYPSVASRDSSFHAPASIQNQHIMTEDENKQGILELGVRESVGESDRLHEQQEASSPSIDGTEDEVVESITEKCFSEERVEQILNEPDEYYSSTYVIDQEDKAVSENISSNKQPTTESSSSETPLFREDTDHPSNDQSIKLSESESLRESTQQNENFRPKSKLETFASEDIQSNQQTIVSPCFYPYMSPYMPPVRLGTHPENSYLKVVSVSQPRVQQQPLYVINPPMYYNIPQQSYAAPPQNYIQNYATIPQHVLPPSAPTAPQLYGSYNSPVHVSSPGGQFYQCNPIPTPTNNIAGVSGVEIRRDATNLQTLMEEFQHQNESFRSSYMRESSLVCPLGEQACLDNTKCVKSYQVCDGEVHCDDASDEIVCHCKQRIAKFRLCDGYCDCPTCDDELGCFGCTEEEFSCNDWSRFRRGTCVLKSQKCDNIRHCEITGKDEEGCSILTDRIGNLSFNTVSNSVGFLHRNFKGKWYPTCLGAEEWANEVCQTESGPSMISPKSHMTLTTDVYNGEFINILPNNEVSLVPACIEDRAAFVECPPIYCGLRYLSKNAYRGDEVDTSIEDTLNDLERYTLGAESTQSGLESKNNGYKLRDYDFYDTEAEPAILEETRIVGGKPSQPAAWPWLVSIYLNGNFHCGGVLINELWVITAAHCVDKYWLFYYEIQAGSLRRFSFAPMDQTRIAQFAIPHESYSKSMLRNDVALIKVSAPFRFNKYVRPICLPSESTAGADFLKGPPPGTKCTTVGWGATVEHGADPDHLREVEVPIISHCKHKDDSDVEEICAGLHEGGKDACQGDSGGPLMCRNPNNPNQWYLSGIVSHGEGCGRPNEPGVYTRVSKYMGWIADHTRDDQAIFRTPLQKCPGFVCKGTKRCIPKKRHCDKIVDCLLGDDELNCDNSFHNLFKHSRSNFFIDKKKEEFENAFVDSMAEVIDPELSVIGAKSVSDISQTSVQSENTDSLKEDLYFKCTQLLQIIPGYKKCNKVFDCEDGTDEMNCSCKDYVENADKGAICDGISDCVDLSDERLCLNCTESEFTCRLSQECIPLSKRCDENNDCKSHEDEINCATLTNGKFLTFDQENQPTLLSQGVVTVNRNGTWKPLCLKNVTTPDNLRASTATKMCNKLGFEEYTMYHKYVVQDKRLVIMNKNDLKILEEANKTPRKPCTDCCDGLYVSCSEKAFTPPTLKHTKLSDSTELYSLPWTAAIYEQGNYKCMGTLIDSNWIVTSRECSDAISRFDENRVTATLGRGKIHLSVKGPHEQTVRIVQTNSVASTNIVLLKTAHNLTLDKYVQSARLDVRRENLQNEKCFAVGLDDNNRVVFVQVIPIKNCLVGYRCFEAKPQEHCKYDQLWSGTIVCDSRNGWYPAAVFSYVKGPCGFSPNMQFTSVKYYKNQITNVINENNKTEIKAPICDGFLCELGNCISKSKICDGISDCHGNEDEDPDLCYEKEHKCHVQDECACSQSQLKCPNSNKCFPKTSYCDRINNCGEYEDEPEICSCRIYLKLTSPDKICDGHLHCMDRSDEDPSVCTCKSGDFQCKKNSTDYCVSQELVCDGIEDCPNGEDEKACLSLKVENHEKTNAGEVLSCTAGVWHTGCFSLNYTTTQLEDICTELGFTGGSATQLSPPKNLTSMEAQRPVLDHFDGVWLRRTPGNRMKLRIRTGNNPSVKFVPDNSCHRLFVACI